MGDILKTWIQARLGILIDLGPKVFGHYTKDGKLLAQILLSYDIITRDQLDLIITTHDPALCRVNLKHLRFWLRFLGIDVDDECIDEISCGNGTTSLRLFYKVYLSLETKDRLHFITLQKEREKFVPASRKFEVSVVCEDPPPYQPPEHPRAKKLLTGKDLITGWQRPKFPAILRKLTREREQLAVPSWEPYPVVQPVVEHRIPEVLARDLSFRCESSDHFPLARLVSPVLSQRPDRVKIKNAEESLEADRFARKTAAKTKRIEDEIEKKEEREEAFATELEQIVEDPEMARAYIEWVKCRRKRAAAVSALNSKMQKTLLHQLWERVSCEQENMFDEAIARRTLDQSRYEKQIITKLCEVRDQRNVMLDNQKIIEDMTEQANEVEHLAAIERDKDRVWKTQRDADAECQRMCELRQRLTDEKIQKIHQRHMILCRETVQDIVNLALKIEDYRQLNNGLVPQTILREWIVKFLKGEPIAETLLSETGDTKIDQLVIEEASRAKLEQIELLREALLDDYLEMNPPWDLFTLVSGRGETEMMKLGRNVLGFIVHRLLNYVDNRISGSRVVSPALSTKFENIAIILGIANPTVHESLRGLLNNLEIPLVRMEDAINYCLDQYKNEMLDVEYIDEKIIEATEKVVKEIESGKDRFSCPRVKIQSRTSKSEETLGGRSQSSPGQSSSTSKREHQSPSAALFIDKQTQTPRSLPYDDMDPVLTDTAYLGKWVYEFLALGEPITNELSTKMLIDYLKTLNGVKCWVLIDYPTTYEQMCLLETALTGYKIPPDPETLQFDDFTVEDVQSTNPRIVYDSGDDPLDSYRQSQHTKTQFNSHRGLSLMFAHFRQSKLVPTPIKRIQDIPTPTFANLFVRVLQKPKELQIEDGSVEALTKNSPSIDKFYASRKIGHFLYYTYMDETTLKKLARLVIGEPLQRKTSDELFGEVPKGHEKVRSRSTGSKAPVVRRMISESEALEDSEIDFEMELDRDDEMITMEDGGQEYESVEPKIARPGEPNWQWVDLPLPSSGFVNVLASLWTSMEETYLGDLKELLFLKSVQTSGIVPYKSSVEKYAAEFVRRPDNKQDLLNDFHLAFNDIDEDARHDADVKCELHRRLADFQAELWNICDKRRQEAEEERRRFIADEWTIYEAAILYNVYVGILQAELDRCVDTLQMIMDYYAGMAEKPLMDARLPKVALNRTEVDNKISTPPVAEQPTSTQLKLTSKKDAADTKRSKSKAGSTKSSAVTPLRFVGPAFDRVLFREQLHELLTNTDQADTEIRKIEVVQAIERNVAYSRNIVEELSGMIDVASQKQDRNDNVKNDVSREEDLALERQYAVDYEIDRIRLRLNAIEAAARSEFAFLLDTMRGTFHRIHDNIVDRYWREMKGINDAVTVFCFAIEEGRYLEREMLLDGDRFIVRSNVFVMKVPTKKPEVVKEVDMDTRFRIAQLSRLMEMFRRVAPHGVMPAGAFVLILQDLVGHGPEEGESMMLPCCWYRLQPVDICTIVDKLFGSASYVDWREFVIYAMDVPTPTHSDILIARDRFRIQDCDLNEVVSVDQFIWTPIWFLECTEIPNRVFELLVDKFHRNPEELYEEELYRLDLDKFDAANELINSHTEVRDSCFLTEENLRLILAKELLSRMYMISRRTVNYTALLLAFCKAADPREGFAKALALVIGSRICSDVAEGERYVQDLYERTRFGHSATPQSLILEQQVCTAVYLKKLSFSKISTPMSEHKSPTVMSSKKSIFNNCIEEGQRSTTYWQVLSLVAFQGTEEVLEEDQDQDQGKDQDQDQKSDSADKDLTAKSSLGESLFGEGDYKFRASDQEAIEYWIPFDVCLTVLAATLPSFLLKPELLGSHGNLRDALTSVYRELKDDELEEQGDIVLAHRLINHRFIRQLLNSTSKFTVKSMGNILLELLRVKRTDRP
ncbi:LOW QUALITY PROTEIN: sperm flagellar protein 2-like [Lasioglossum baleicum]|uniref:LOW QUALITY PROTEIN: sperm flagellar protein 2-like n=1 Tax=Lasioglossum baleicum TaxID=434251 RepID=UPI003FCD817F